MDYLREIRSQYTRDHIPGLQEYKRELEEEMEELERAMENWKCSTDCSECFKNCPVTRMNTREMELYSSIYDIEEDIKQLTEYGYLD